MEQEDCSPRQEKYTTKNQYHFALSNADQKKRLGNEYESDFC